MTEARDAKQAAKFAAMTSDVKAAQEMDDLSHAYFDQLLAGRPPKAATAYKAMMETMWSQHHGSATISTRRHYIVCLDMSGSMEGGKFDAARAAVKNFAAAAALQNQGTDSAISLIMFDHYSHVLCDVTPLEYHSTCESKINFSGGGTNFANPLRDAISLIRRTAGQFEKQVILLYTDGLANYPTQEVDDMVDLRQELIENVDFFAIAEQKVSSLESICGKLYDPAVSSDHCLSHIGPERISTAFQETLRRINIAYVAPQ